MKQLSISTSQKKEIVDITQQVEKYLASHSGSGLIHIFVSHTTAAITTADLDPGTDLDMLDAFEAIIPNLDFRHPHDPSHAPDHIMSSIIGPSLFVPFSNKKLHLGVWQRIILVELDGPRKRNVFLSVIRAEIK